MDLRDVPDSGGDGPVRASAHPERGGPVEQLTGLDAAFLALETPAVYGHVGSVSIVDVDAFAGDFTLERLTRTVAARLDGLPPFRRRLVTVPLGLDQPYWIEDPDFDIEFHVRELALPAPGDDHQLAEQVARLHARPLDRRRPLWEMYLIHGLSGGRAAIYAKVHHAAIDGVAGNDVVSELLDLSPEGRPSDDGPVTWEGEREPGTSRLLLSSVTSLAKQPLRTARLAYGLARSLPSLGSSPIRPHLPVIDKLLGRDAKVALPSQRFRAPRTPFNAPISPHRRWAFRDLALADVKQVKSAAGVTVNDVVMALCAGALRRWLSDRGQLPDEPLIAAVPVSIRSEGEQHGNRVSAMIAPLATHLADPAQRLATTGRAMLATKEQHGALPAELLTDVTQVAAPALANQAARLNARLRLLERVSPFNLIISNVPGPRVRLYYAGAPLLAYYPLSAIAHGQGLNITVMSYRDTMFLGLLACRELVPDLETLADHVVDELRDLVALTG
jgi:diacylglycerol O-acyltransferase / wax synthase